MLIFSFWWSLQQYWDYKWVCNAAKLWSDGVAVGSSCIWCVRHWPNGLSFWRKHILCYSYHMTYNKIVVECLRVLPVSVISLKNLFLVLVSSLVFLEPCELCIFSCVNIIGQVQPQKHLQAFSFWTSRF